ncbi:MAG: glycoside hydrolase family 99-like domain-containing protein [Pseudomonadota bacterium]
MQAPSHPSRPGKRTRVIAFYLPQFHPIPENDAFWEKGFTEWTNVRRARPLFRGHRQPLEPGELGYYDLRDPAIREQQARLARNHGVDAFCYYHYWFAGRRVLERPFEEVLASGRPDFPFCLCWANQSWSGVWHGAPDRVLIEQTYPGPADDQRHFESLLPAFEDPRYIRVDDRPLFVVFEPLDLPDRRAFVDRWQAMAREAGLPGLFLAAVWRRSQTWWNKHHGLDARIAQLAPPLRSAGATAAVLPYANIARHLVPSFAPDGRTIACVYPNWDNTPRCGDRGRVWTGATPALFARQVRRALRWLRTGDDGPDLLFVKSWNEWAEGNYLEPDARYGRGWLESLSAELERVV